MKGVVCEFGGPYIEVVGPLDSSIKGPLVAVAIVDATRVVAISGVFSAGLSAKLPAAIGIVKTPILRGVAGL